MKRTITILICAFFLTPGLMMAQSVESFDYDTGQTLEGLESPDDWGGPWVLLKGNEQTSIEAGGISVPSVSANSGSNHLAITHNAGDGGARLYRLLNTPVSDDGGTYYLSWFMDNEYENPGGNGSVNQVIITNSAGFGAGGPGGQLIRMGKIFNTERVGVDGISGAAGNAEGTDTRNAMWIVAVVEMSGDTEAETLYLFVNPDPRQPLDFGAADITASPTLNDGFDAIGAKLEGPATLNGRIDELRFGDSYEAVISDNLVAIAGQASETFNDYEVGALLGATASEGNGWIGPWVAESGLDFTTITEGGITNFDILKQTSGNKATADYSAAETPNLRFERPLAGVFPDDGSTYYVSFSTQSTITDLNNTVSFFMLVDTAALAAGGPGGQLLQIGKPLNTANIGVGFGANPGQFSMTSASAADPHFIVARVRMSGDAEVDTVDIYIDPTLDAEPTEPDATFLSGRLNNGFNGLGFKVEGLAPGIVTDFEDYYIGLSYEEVIPTDWIDVDNPVDALAFDKFSYAPGEELAGQGGAEDGWASAWEGLNEPDSSIILAGGLVNESLLVKTSGERVRVSSIGTPNRLQRVFETPLDAETGNFWFSMNMGINGSPVGNVGSFLLIDTSQTGDAIQQVIIGKQFNSTNIFATGSGQAGGATQTGVQFDGSTANWLVGHMTWNETNMNWELDLWVDPAPGSEPQEADANIQNKVYNTPAFHAAGIRAEGAAGVNFEVDDLLFGLEYSQVVPNDLEPIPPLPDGATEKFNDYSVGSNLAGQDGGSGYDAPWNLITGEDPVIEEGGLTNFFTLKQTSGNYVSFSSNARMARSLEGEYGDVGRTFWLSWSFGTRNGGGNVAHLVLADEDAYMDSGPGGQLAQIGKTFGGAGFGLVGAPGGTAAGVNTDTTHWIVVEVATNGSLDNDPIYIWVDPDPATAPSRDTADIVGAADLTNWNAIGFKVEGGPGVTARWDDVLLGNNFLEVVPDDWTDVDPPEIPVPAVETFDYTAGEDLNGQDGGEGWGGPWEQVEGAITIAEGEIESDRVDSQGNRAEVNQMSDPVTYDRPFFNRFGTEASTVWLSYLIDADLKNIGNSGFLSLVNEGEPVLSIGGVPGLENLSVRYNNGEEEENSTTTSFLDTYWMVVRLDMNGTDDPDEARIWISPSADALPADGNALFTLTNIDLDDGFDALRISASGFGNLDMFVDEFRIGFSYRDISNKFGSDDPNLIAFEPFNYDAGSSLINAGGINAFWDGVWEDNGNLSTNEANITEGSVALPGFEAIGNKTEFQYLNDGTQIRIDRELAFPMESDGSVYWLTWFQNTTTGDMLNNVSNVGLLNPAIAANGGQRLNIGRMYGNGKLGLIAPPANQPRSSEIDDIGLNWIVVKIQTVDDPAVRDTVWMWINPSAEMEPDTADAEVLTSNTGVVSNFYAMNFIKDGITHIRLKTEGAGGGETPHVVEFDEVRLARTWESANTLVNTIEVAPKDVFRLSAFPNPFVDQLNLKFEVPASDNLLITLHDTQGRLISTLADGKFAQGEHHINWEVGSHHTGLMNGIYYLRVAQRDSVTVRKLILLR